MFCRNCGTENADGSPTCVSCGAQLTPVNPYAAGGQPAGPPPGTKPDNYLVQSILVTLCCCLIFGIVAIIYAAQVDTKWNAGDHQGAIVAAQNAKKWTLIAFVVGLLINVVLFGLQILVGVRGANAGGAGGF